MTPTERVEAHFSGNPLRGDDCIFALELAADLERVMACNECGDKTLLEVQAHVTELENWKSQMLQVWAQIDSQKIADMLGANVGDSCFETINRRVPKVMEKLAASEAGASVMRNELLGLLEFADTLDGVTASGSIVASCLRDRIRLVTQRPAIS